MSYQYPQYPQYPQPPSQPPGQLGDLPPIDPSKPPGAGDVNPPQDTYAPVPPAPNDSPAYWQSLQATNIAAGKQPAELAVKVPDPPEDFPLAMYNKQTRETKAAKDKDEQQKLEGKGFTKDPLPPDSGAITPQDVQALMQLWQAAGEALKKLAAQVEQQQKQMQAASNILGAGQQPGQGQEQQRQGMQNPYAPGYPYTPAGN
jgi:hypothetical protein